MMDDICLLVEVVERAIELKRGLSAYTHLFGKPTNTVDLGWMGTLGAVRTAYLRLIESAVHKYTLDENAHEPHWYASRTTRETLDNKPLAEKLDNVRERLIVATKGLR